MIKSIKLLYLTTVFFALRTFAMEDAKSNRLISLMSSSDEEKSATIDALYRETLIKAVSQLNVEAVKTLASQKLVNCVSSNKNANALDKLFNVICPLHYTPDASQEAQEKAREIFGIIAPLTESTGFNLQQILICIRLNWNDQLQFIMQQRPDLVNGSLSDKYQGCVTPILIAINNKNYKALKILLSYNPDLSMKCGGSRYTDTKDISLYDHAMVTQDKRIIKLFTDATEKCTPKEIVSTHEPK